MVTYCSFCLRDGVKSPAITRSLCQHHHNLYRRARRLLSKPICTHCGFKHQAPSKRIPDDIIQMLTHLQEKSP